MNGYGELSTWVVRDGKRKQTLSIGTFTNGLMNGQGRIEIEDLAVFEGEFKNSLPNGPGVLVVNGDNPGRFTGEFQGKIEGLGMMDGEPVPCMLVNDTIYFIKND